MQAQVLAGHISEALGPLAQIIGRTIKRSNITVKGRLHQAAHWHFIIGRVGVFPHRGSTADDAVPHVISRMS